MTLQFKHPISFLPIQVPRDDQDQSFVQSFSMEDKANMHEFFDRYGFVVIQNVLSEQEIDDSLEEIWSIIERSGEGRIIRSQPDTWTSENGWPWGAHVGMLGSVAWTQVAMRNRTNRLVHDAFKMLLGVDGQVVCAFDRYGAMRPTMCIPLPYPASLQKPFGSSLSSFGEITSTTIVQHKSEWRSRAAWLHWDTNPWRLRNLQDDSPETKAAKLEKDTRKWRREAIEQLQSDDPESFFMSEQNSTQRRADEVRLQGFLALSEARAQDGCFVCVPGFHKHIIEWSRAYPFDFDDDFVPILGDDPLHGLSQQVPVRAGSLVLWDSRLPHANSPNESERFRFVQYLKMFSLENIDQEVLPLRQKMVPELGDLSWLDDDPNSTERKQILGL